MEALWEIVLQVRDEKVYKKASMFLQKLYKRMNQKLLSERLSEIKKGVLQTCMDQMRKSLTDLNDSSSQLNRGMNEATHEDSTNRTARSIKVLSRFIEDFEGYKNHLKGGADGQAGKEEEEVKLTIRNQVTHSQGPTKFEICVPAVKTTIENLKEQVASTIFPKRKAKELSLMYKGKDLREGLKTIKEVVGTFQNTQPVIMILTSKSLLELEYE